MVRLLFLGDIVGKPGRRVVKECLPALIEELRLDLVVANGENAAGGFGLTLEVAEELFGAGIDVITMGNHTWKTRRSPRSLPVMNRCCVRPITLRRRPAPVLASFVPAMATRWEF